MKQTFLAYWLGYYEGGNSLENTPPEVDTIALAFGVTDKGNTITTNFLTSHHSKEEIQAGVKALQSRGTKVVMSISGNPHWPNHPYGWENLDPTLFAENAYNLIVDEWGLDGIDLDNEGSYNPEPSPNGNFVQVIEALRAKFGNDKTISLPVYLGTYRDAYLKYVANSIDYVFTMAYWLDYQGQISMLQDYQSLVGADKAGIGVADAANAGQNTDFSIVPNLSKFSPKSGMMFWNLNADGASKWCTAIGDNLP